MASGILRSDAVDAETTRCLDRINGTRSAIVRDKDEATRNAVKAHLLTLSFITATSQSPEFFEIPPLDLFAPPHRLAIKKNTSLAIYKDLEAMVRQSYRRVRASYGSTRVDAKSRKLLMFVGVRAMRFLTVPVNC